MSAALALRQMLLAVFEDPSDVSLRWIMADAMEEYVSGDNDKATAVQALRLPYGFWKVDYNALPGSLDTDLLLKWYGTQKADLPSRVPMMPTLGTSCVVARMVRQTAPKCIQVRPAIVRDLRPAGSDEVTVCSPAVTAGADTRWKWMCDGGCFGWFAGPGALSPKVAERIGLDPEDPRILMWRG